MENKYQIQFNWKEQTYTKELSVIFKNEEQNIRSPKIQVTYKLQCLGYEGVYIDHTSQWIRQRVGKQKNHSR